MDEKTITNEDLGYDSFFESNREKLGLSAFQVARVIAEYKGVYKVKNTSGEFLAKITGKQMIKSLPRENYPAIGDWVAISEINDEQAVISAILPRRTTIQRKRSHKNEMQLIATNIDVAFVVESINRDYSLNRFERYFAIASNEGVKPAIILNKIDLIPKEELALKITELKNRFTDTDIILTSVLTDEGLGELRKHILKGKTYCFLGSSGVGKSSLINRLLGSDTIKTESIGLGNERGKHATTSREMYFLENGSIVIDNPGMREVGMTDANAGIDNLFDQITDLAKKCKFVDCSHSNEPGCAVILALKSGALDREKYSNYINLKKESKHYKLTGLEKKDKDLRFGKFIKKAKKDLKKYGHKDYND